jgi:Icc-related predicted phosphoesterase
METSDGHREPLVPNPGADERACIRVAAAADVHTRESRRDHTKQALEELRGTADLLLLAGDLTTYGRPAEARVLADACSSLDIPIFAVLGNHDWHANHSDEVVGILEEGGVTVLDRSYDVVSVSGYEVGVVGVKGFIGGFAGLGLTDFGEPLLRQAYAETTAEVEALDEGLRGVSHCPVRLVVMHYSPTAETVAGEPCEIHAFLGSDRLAAPLLEHQPDLVVHGHAHSGQFSGRIGELDVFNVSVEVTGRDFWLFELTPATAVATPVH